MVRIRLSALVAMVAAIIILLLLQAYNLSLFYGHVDWARFGDVATWFTGLATTSAVIVALRESLRQQMQANTIAQRAERDMHAWVDQDDTGWVLKLSNGSGAPITHWLVDLSTGQHFCWRSSGSVPPGRLTLQGLPLLTRFPALALWFSTPDGGSWKREYPDAATAAELPANQVAEHSCEAP